MKAFSIIVSILVVLGCVMALLPGFALMEIFIGMEPVIICVALLLVSILLGIAFKDTPFGKFLGYVIVALMIGVVLYFAVKPDTPEEIGQLIAFVGLLILGIFLTNVMQGIPFLDGKAIPIMWFILFWIYVGIFTSISGLGGEEQALVMYNNIGLF